MDTISTKKRKLSDEINGQLSTDKHEISVDKHNGSMCRDDSRRGIKLCPLCDLSFSTAIKIEEHLIDAHGSIITIEQQEFSSYEEFKCWKCLEEAQTSTQYNTRTSRSKHNYNVYQCHRSGHQRIQGRGVKQRRKPTDKINRCCPARITTTVVGEKLRVVFHKTHFGHDVKGLRLSEEQRKRYEEMIGKKMTLSKILKEVRLSTQSRSEVRLRTVLPRDECYLNGEETFSSFIPEHQRLGQWVLDQVNCSENCVLSYRSETNEYDHGDFFQKTIDANSFADGELLLVLMTHRQSEFISQIETKSVVLDCCRGVTDHTYEVATLILMDEFGNGCPVAFCLASNICARSLANFFSIVKDSHGILTAKIFMSIDEPEFYDSWTGVMGKAEHVLLSSWDVERQWRIQLNSTVEFGQLSKIEIYHACCVLLERTDLVGFSEDLKTFSAMCEEHPETVGFGEYFGKTYANRAEQWAFCYRRNFNLKNHKLEMLHRRLQFCYGSSGSRIHRKLEICVNKLLKFGDEVLLARVIQKVKRPAKIADVIALNHQKSKMITADTIVAKGENIWTVASGSDVETVSVTPEIHCSCQYKCLSCGHCFHQFSCTCSGYLHREEFCEHAHACFMLKSNERRTKIQHLSRSLNSILSIVPKLTEDDRSVVKKEMQILYDLTRSFVKNKTYK